MFPGDKRPYYDGDRALAASPNRGRQFGTGLSCCWVPANSPLSPVRAGLGCCSQEAPLGPGPSIKAPFSTESFVTVAGAAWLARCPAGPAWLCTPSTGTSFWLTERRRRPLSSPPPNDQCVRAVRGRPWPEAEDPTPTCCGVRFQ